MNPCSKWLSGSLGATSVLALPSTAAQSHPGSVDTPTRSLRPPRGPSPSWRAFRRGLFGHALPTRFCVCGPRQPHIFVPVAIQSLWQCLWSPGRLPRPPPPQAGVFQSRVEDLRVAETTSRGVPRGVGQPIRPQCYPIHFAWPVVRSARKATRKAASKIHSLGGRGVKIRLGASGHHHDGNTHASPSIPLAHP